MEKCKLSCDQLIAEQFKFKKFSLFQSSSVFKVNTDAVLLAASIHFNGSYPNKILEIGTGTGVISMCLHQMFGQSIIKGIDISMDAAALFEKNIQYNQFDNVFSICSKLQEFYPEETYDLIVSNPPYFTSGIASNKSHNLNARHNITLNFEDLFIHSNRLLKSEGTLWIIIPTNSVSEIQQIGQKNNLFIQKHLTVYPKPGKDSKRTILCFSKHVEENKSTKEDLTILNLDNEYSYEYKNLTKDFYLKF